MNAPTIGSVAANLRRLEARVAQLEDAIAIYGPEPKRKRLPIPEITPAQREFLIWMAVFATLSLVTAAARRGRE